MSTLTATPISESSVITAYNRDTASNADINTFTAAFKSVTDAIIIDLATLNTDKLDPDDDITFTGDNTFSGTNTFSAAVTMTSTLAVTGNITYAGNLVSSGTSKTINFNTNVVTNIGAASATTDAIQYQQAVKATGSVAENITGTKTFTTALPICSVVPASGSDLTNKTYVDLQVFGNSGITQSTSAPATTAGALWLNTTSTSNYELFRANGTAFAPVTGIFQGSSAPTAPAAATGRLWLDTTSSTQLSLKRYDGSTWRQCLPATVDGATTFTSAVTMSASTVFSAGFSVAPSQTIDFNSNVLTEVGTPVSGTDAANKTYVDSAAVYVKQFVQTTNGSASNTVEASLLGAGVGSLTIPANTLSAGSIIRITAKGTITSSTASPSFTMQTKVNGSTDGSIAIDNYGAAPTTAPYRLESILTIMAGGSGGTWQSETTLLTDDPNSAIGTRFQAHYRTTTQSINCTTTNTVGLTMQATGGTNTTTCLAYIVEIIK